MLTSPHRPPVAQAAAVLQTPSRATRAGFTLTELMVAIALSGIFIASAMQAFIFQQRSLNSSKIMSEVKQDVRTALDMVSRDLRMAGYGLNVYPEDIPLWLDWASDLAGNSIAMNTNPLIVDGGGVAPDSVWVAAAYDEPLAILSANAPKGATTLSLQSGQGSRFNNTEKKVIYLGKSETARVISVSGDTLTISTDAVQPRGLRHPHPTGTRVELVVIRSYEWNGPTNAYPERPYLTRDENISAQFTYFWERMIALGIEDFQLVDNGDNVGVSLTGRASVKDDRSQETDKHRRFVLDTQVFLRNFEG